MKVVNIINPFKVVINAGSADGITEGTRFLIYRVGENIIDPETNEDLGALEIVRGTGVAVHVQERLSTIESDRKTKGFRKVISSPNLNALNWPQIFASTLGKEEIIDTSNNVPYDDAGLGDIARKI